LRTSARLAAFAAVLGITFGAAALVGGAVDPLRDGDDRHGHGGDGAAGHTSGHGEPAGGADRPAGLAVAQDGYRLEAETAVLPRGRDARLAFRIVGPGGGAVTGFEVEHERRMHLIVVRRDLSGFQHLHPTMAADGRWSTRLRLPTAGVYRAYADFSAGGRSMTLATDLVVPGPFTPRALPAPAATDAAEGYAVRLRAGGVAAGEDAGLAYEVSRGGETVRDVEPYLGADGHLVALREGDLAFLHVHPEESATPGTIRFGAALPSPGRYRLFLQFKHDGAVRTVAHTLEVAR
jgi:hypothetical protein